LTNENPKHGHLLFVFSPLAHFYLSHHLILVSFIYFLTKPSTMPLHKNSLFKKFPSSYPSFLLLLLLFKRAPHHSGWCNILFAFQSYSLVLCYSFSCLVHYYLRSWSHILILINALLNLMT
jgi:hypothetical protein